MKCGEICARSARSSACASRSSCAASADSSTWAETSAGDLGHHPRVLRPQPPLGAVERGEPADPLALDDAAARPPCARTGSGPRSTATRSESGSHSRVRRGQPVGGEHLAAVVDQHARGLRQRVQVPDRLARRLAREPAAQVRERRRRGVQRGAHALLAGREHPPRRRQPADRQRRGGEHDAEQHAEQDVHPPSIRPAHDTGAGRRSAPAKNSRARATGSGRVARCQSERS